MVVGLAAVLGEFLGVSSSFLSLSCLPWVGVLSFGFVSKSCSCPLGWSWSLSRFRAPFSSLLCFLSPRGTPEAIAKFFSSPSGFCSSWVGDQFHSQQHLRTTLKCADSPGLRRRLLSNFLLLFQLPPWAPLMPVLSPPRRKQKIAQPLQIR